MSAPAVADTQPPSRSVCVLIAACNAQATVARAIASALREAEVSEVFVIDDASGDRTLAEAAAADDGSGRLSILRQHTNGGPAAARNRAIDACTSQWVGVLDADDFFEPGRIAALLNHAGEAEMIADNMWQVAEHDPQGARRSLLPTDISTLKVNFSEFVLSNVSDSRIQRAELGFIKPLMNKSFLDRHGIRYREHMRLGEDFELYARALALGARLVVLPQPGYVSVVRTDSLSSRHSEADLLSLRDCNHDLGRLAGLSKADRHALRQHFLSVDCRLQWRLLIQAVKSGHAAAALLTFIRPYPVPFYLVRQLLQAALSRGRRNRVKAT